MVRDKKGEIYSVRYDAVNAMLLNEFLKEHKKVEEQQATITDLKSTVAQQMEVLTAQLKEQAAQIQKVSAQVELNKPTARTVADKCRFCSPPEIDDLGYNWNEPPRFDAWRLLCSLRRGVFLCVYYS